MYELLAPKGTSNWNKQTKKTTSSLKAQVREQLSWEYMDT